MPIDPTVFSLSLSLSLSLVLPSLLSQISPPQSAENSAKPTSETLLPTQEALAAAYSLSTGRAARGSAAATPLPASPSSPLGAFPAAASPPPVPPTPPQRPRERARERLREERRLSSCWEDDAAVFDEACIAALARARCVWRDLGWFSVKIEYQALETSSRPSRRTSDHRQARCCPLHRSRQQRQKRPLPLCSPHSILRDRRKKARSQGPGQGRRQGGRRRVFLRLPLCRRLPL